MSDMHSRSGRRLNVAVLCSRRAPGLVQLLNRDARRGIDYEIVCCITSSDTFSEEVRVERRGVPCLPHSIRNFCRDRGAELQDMEARAVYDALTLELLAPYSPDVVLLVGYRLLLTRAVLDTFEGRIINLHHGDLTRRDENGAPRFVGLGAVRDALVAGEPETRATSHVVTDRLYEGPVMLRSWSFPTPAVAEWARRAKRIRRAACGGVGSGAMDAARGVGPDADPHPGAGRARHGATGDSLEAGEGRPLGAQARWDADARWRNGGRRAVGCRAGALVTCETTRETAAPICRRAVRPQGHERPLDGLHGRRVCAGDGSARETNGAVQWRRLCD